MVNHESGKKNSKKAVRFIYINTEEWTEHSFPRIDLGTKDYFVDIILGKLVSIAVKERPPNRTVSLCNSDGKLVSLLDFRITMLPMLLFHLP